jgi:D-alanyl-D-alanine carboxypeptidase
VTALSTALADALAAEAGGRGIASAAAIEKAGAQPEARWVPESNEEPAFLVYSITKTITAALLLRSAELGQLSVDDPLSRWFPRISHATQISLRRLLNHTSGIPDYGGLRAYHEAVRSSPSAPWSFDRFAAETFEKGLMFEPGNGWSYSNPAYMLLKRILEETAGVSYRTLVDERIATPLGLRRTFVAESIADLASLASGTSTQLSQDGAPQDVRAHYHPGWVSHGVVASTATEIVRIFDALFDGQILSRKSLAQMTELVALPDDPSSSATELPAHWGRPGYGLGLMGDPAAPWGLSVGHNGGGPCYSASVFRAVDLGGATVCAMGAIEEGFNAESVVVRVLHGLMGTDARDE